MSTGTHDRLRWLVRHHLDEAPEYLRKKYRRDQVFQCLREADKAGDNVEEIVDELIKDRCPRRRAGRWCTRDAGHRGDCFFESTARGDS